MPSHMQIFSYCLAREPQSHSLRHALHAESWLKIFQKLKDYLLVSICDDELVEDALVIFHNFLTSSTLKFTVYEECKDSALIDLLFGNLSDNQSQ